MRKAKKKTTRKPAAKKTKKKKVIRKAAPKKVCKPKKEKVSSSPAVSSAGASVEEIGIVTHYFPHVEAAVVKLTKGALSLGDTIVIKGHTTDFKEKVDSIQLDHVPVETASVGQEVGLKVKSRVREHDSVYRLVG